MRDDGNAVKFSRHSGMDRRNPDSMDGVGLGHPCSLDSGDPCRNDDVSCSVGLVYNGQYSSVGMQTAAFPRRIPAGAWEPELLIFLTE